MKTAIVYYSFEGNTDYIASMAAEKLGAELIRIDAVKNYPRGGAKFLVGGASASFRTKPRLKEYSFDAAKYDTVIIGTPIWASTFAPAVKTFLSENNLSGKKIGYIICSSGGRTEKCVNNLNSEIGCTGAAILSAVDPLVKKTSGSDESYEEAVAKFCEELGQHHTENA